MASSLNSRRRAERGASARGLLASAVAVAACDAAWAIDAPSALEDAGAAIGAAPELLPCASPAPEAELRAPPAAPASPGDAAGEVAALSDEAAALAK